MHSFVVLFEIFSKKIGCDLGSLSNVVEIASARYKPQEHLSPVDLYISQTIREPFQHLDLGVATFSKAVSRPVVKVVQYRIPPVS